MQRWLQGRVAEHSSTSTQVFPSSFRWKPGQHLHYGHIWDDIRDFSYSEILQHKMALTIKLPFILERETSTHYKCEAFQTGCGKINSVASSAVFHLVTKPTLKIWQPTTSDHIKALIQTYCTKAQKFHHTSVTMLCPPPTKKITQSACISCSAPTANPFRIQSYNLEGLSADLPVQATNG